MPPDGKMPATKSNSISPTRISTSLNTGSKTYFDSAQYAQGKNKAPHLRMGLVVIKLSPVLRWLTDGGGLFVDLHFSFALCNYGFCNVVWCRSVMAELHG